MQPTRARLRLSLFNASLLLAPPGVSAQLPQLISYEPSGAHIETYLEHSVMSPTGRQVLFLVSSSLQAGAEPTCYRWHLRDRNLGTTEVISRKSNGDSVNCDHAVFRGSSADIDATGRFVVFDQYGGGIVPDALPIGRRVYLHDRADGSVRLIGPPASQRASQPSIDDAGRRVALLTGTTAESLAVYDIATGHPISVHNARFPSEPAISGDGRRVVFTAYPDGSIFTVRPQVYLLHLDDQRVELLSATPSGAPGNDTSLNPTINYDGSIVAFESTANDLVPGIFARLLIRDVDARTTIVPRDGQGQVVQGGTPSISGDGQRIAFHGYCFAQFVPPEQACSWDRTTRRVTLVSRNADGQPAALGLISNRCNDIGVCVISEYRDLNPTISGNGRFVAFVSRGPNLVADDANGNGIDVYAVDLGGASGVPTGVPLGPRSSILLALLLVLGGALTLRDRTLGGE